MVTLVVARITTNRLGQVVTCIIKLKSDNIITYVVPSLCSVVDRKCDYSGNSFLLKTRPAFPHRWPSLRQTLLKFWVGWPSILSTPFESL